MARFDIFNLRGGLAVDCQADMLSAMPTRFVVPLETPHRSLVVSEQLNPSITVGDERLVLVPQLAGTVRVRDLGSRIASLADQHDQYRVQRALDLLMTGV